MFTGIVDGIGKVLKIKNMNSFRELTVEFPKKLTKDLECGYSVSCNGCCLSVTKIDNQKVSFEVIRETLKLTNLKELKQGEFLNLERSMKSSSEIGGHIMSGHISTIAKMKKTKIKNDNSICFLLQNNVYMKYIFYKGFIGIDGISLTVGKIYENCFFVYLIPETIRRTTIMKKNTNSSFNIEIDFYTKSLVDTVEKFIKEKNFIFTDKNKNF
ncbi:hypothetical protein AOQ88_01735 [Candidatus Riesia sp. GBBU]|nr:hypothetical protein AOQ88_01735 [Candidatus Riesia sp. GBBU]